MLDKSLFSFIAILLTFLGFIPYIRSIVQAKIKPHVFSWLIWGMTTLIIFFAQLEGGAGVGAWPIGLSGSITLYVAYLSFVKKGDMQIKGIDWFCFMTAIASIPLWVWTSDPMWAVIVLTFIDLLGFGPTFRKAYAFPEQESLTFFMIFFFRNSFAVLGLETFNLTTSLFPLATGFACFLLIMMILIRRRLLQMSSSK